MKVRSVQLESEWRGREMEQAQEPQQAKGQESAKTLVPGRLAYNRSPLPQHPKTGGGTGPNLLSTE